MTDVVGLRFVAEGEQETIAALKRYSAVNTEVSNATRQSVQAIERMESQVRALQQGLAQGRVGQDNFAASIREIKRQYAELAGVSIQKASAEIERFKRILNQQTTAETDIAARMGFDRLLATLDPAVAAVQRFQQAMEVLNTAQERGVINSREYAEVQARLLTNLDAAQTGASTLAREGFERVAASVDPVLAATQRYEQQLQVLRTAEESGQASAAETARVRERLAQQYKTDVDRLTGVADAQRRAQQTEQDSARTKEQAARAYDQLTARLDPAIAAQQRFAATQKIVNDAVRNGIITQEQGTQTMNVYRASLNAMEAASLKGETATSRLRQQFLATANSIAILDGPLGGIASRFSAFGVLIGRTGLLIGGALVAFAAFGAVLNRGTRALVEWEAANARVNAILQTTGYQAGLTGEQIRHMTSQIALGTLETEQSVMQAAQRLLTFRDIAGDVFESVLRTAADMAALGFGTIESEAVKLAKALEDPAQALTSLSRAGIVFTRQQRQVIIALVESGRQAEAMERILANVNARVGGAAEAAARDTLAGAFDTIGQAAGRAVREIAGAVLQVTGLDAAIRALAASVADFAGGSTTTPAQRLEVLRAQAADLSRVLTQGMSDINDPLFERFGSTDMFGRLVVDAEALQTALRFVNREMSEVVGQLNVMAVARARQQVSRDTEALESLGAEVDLRRELIGLTEEEQRLQRSLAQLGLRNLDIEQRVSTYAAQLRSAGVDQGFLNRLTDDYRAKLGEVAAEIERARVTGTIESQARAFQSALTNLEQQNVLLDQQHYFMQQGLSAADARQRAEETLLITQSTILAQMDPTNSKLQEMADRIALAVGYSRDLKAQMDAIADAERRRAEIRDFIQNLEDEVQLLNIQLGLLRQGVSFTESQRRATIALHQARIAQLVTEGEITKELGKQLSMRLAQLAAEGENLRVQIETFRPARGGGGRAQEVITLQALQDELLREQAIRRELLGLMGEELRIREVYYDLVRRLGDEAVNYTEAQIMGTARLISEQMALNEAVERQRQLQEQVANTLTNLFMAATQGAESFKQALSGVLRQLAQMLANRAFMQIMGRFGLGFMAPLPKAANGMAFSGGNIIPFAKGGVVDSPTLFPMSHGRTGLMGEAGPEAVVPLRRGKDGKLGIGAEPQRVAVDVRVHMDENGNWKTNVARIADSRVSRAAPRIISQSVGATYAAASERKMR